MLAREAELLLELMPPYDLEQVRKAYKRQSKIHHPDRGGEEEAFKRVDTAYRTLEKKLTSPAPTVVIVMVDQLSFKAWQFKQRQHQPYNARDFRSASHARSGAVFQQAEPEQSPWAENSQAFGISMLAVDGVILDTILGWRVQIVCRSGTPVLSFHPPKPIRSPDKVVCGIVIDGIEEENGDDEPVCIEGDVTERSYDKDGLVTFFCADLFGALG